MIGLGHFLTFSAILFTLGVFGIFLNRKNVIVILMSIELILLAVNINFVAFSAYLNDLAGQVFAMFVLTVAAGEAAIGLAPVVAGLFGRQIGDRGAQLVTCALMGVTALCAWINLFANLGEPAFKVELFQWVVVGSFDASWVLRVDP